MRAAEPPPAVTDVWKWFRTGLFDAIIFLMGAVISSIVQVRTGFQWMILIGVLIAVVLTNLRRLPTRHKAVKAGYFGGLAGLFTIGMLAMLFVMPRDAWASVMGFAGVMAAISLAAIIIGLRAVPNIEKPDPDARP